MLKIITDSASDLPKSYIEKHELHVIPTPVVIDEVDYFDGDTIQTGEFYDILDDIKRDIRTYHINPALSQALIAKLLCTAPVLTILTRWLSQTANIFCLKLKTFTTLWVIILLLLL